MDSLPITVAIEDLLDALDEDQVVGGVHSAPGPLITAVPGGEGLTIAKRLAEVSIGHLMEAFGTASTASVDEPGGAPIARACSVADRFELERLEFDPSPRPAALGYTPKAQAGLSERFDLQPWDALDSDLRQLFQPLVGILHDMGRFPSLAEEDRVPDARRLEYDQSTMVGAGLGEDDAPRRGTVEEIDLRPRRHRGDLFGHRGEHGLERRKLRAAFRTSP